LISDRPGFGVPPSTFAWQAIKASWLSRPYGTPDTVFSPRIHFGYYEIRVHDVAHYVPRAGWTALECDNSPHAGFQAVTCMRSMIGDMQPLRKTLGTDISQDGISVPNSQGIEAYPFRNDQNAVVAFMPGDGGSIDRPHTIGLPSQDIELLDSFANRIECQKEKGRLNAPAGPLPVYVRMPATNLDGFLKNLAKVEIKRKKEQSSHNYSVGQFVVRLDRKRKGIVQVDLKKGKDLHPLITGIQTDTPLSPQMQISTQGNSQMRSIRIYDRGVPLRRAFTLVADSNSIKFTFSARNVSKDAQPKGHARLVLGSYIKGKSFDYYQRVAGGKATGIRGSIWHDFNKYDVTGGLSSPADKILRANRSALLNITGCYSLEISTSTGHYYKTSTPPGFVFIVREGQAYLESGYELGRAQGFGSRGHATFSTSVDVLEPGSFQQTR
ncbi:MAG: hypothetical protein QF473_06470, partial [Planctomycetota bacterium]|nr:hypothetical protein [Planctomycetota bacterium]